MTLAVTLTVDELRALVREEVQRVRGPAIASAPAPEVMTRRQVAELLQVHEQVVGRYVRERGLPGSKIADGEWRFLRSEVLAWVRAQRKEVG